MPDALRFEHKNGKSVLALRAIRLIAVSATSNIRPVVKQASDGAFVRHGTQLADIIQSMDPEEHEHLLAETERALTESENLLSNITQSEKCLREMIAALKEELDELRKLQPTENGA